VIVYLSIGNSDDKLSQKEWSQFNVAIMARIKPLATVVHGEWSSAPWSAYQNACWCLEFAAGSAELTEAREVLAEIRDEFRQDSIAWATAETEFI
jgi:hypothetical protein